MAKAKTQHTINLGDIAKDIITGVTGTVIASTKYLTNCERLTIQPMGLKDGKPIQPLVFDVLSLEFVKHGAVTVVPATRPRELVGLGDFVIDTLTGLKGVVTCHTIWHNGCSRVVIQPEELKDGAPVESTAADETDVKILKRGKIKPHADETGGPRPAATLR